MNDFHHGRKATGRPKSKITADPESGVRASNQLLLNSGVLYHHEYFLKLKEETQLNYHIRFLPFMRAES
jgi:hypothetical protein